MSSVNMRSISTTGRIITCKRKAKKRALLHLRKERREDRKQSGPVSITQGQIEHHVDTPAVILGGARHPVSAQSVYVLIGGVFLYYFVARQPCILLHPLEFFSFVFGLNTDILVRVYKRLVSGDRDAYHGLAHLMLCDAMGWGWHV
jgi:hypothetical protein